LQALRSELVELLMSIDRLTLRRLPQSSAGKPTSASTAPGTVIQFRQLRRTS
jgi:hypothetical protein